MCPNMSWASGVSSIKDCKDQISELEDILDSQIYTIKDRTELEEVIPSAQEIILGPPCRNSHLSKQMVCLDACEKLHQIGALSDHLLPVIDIDDPDPTENNSFVKNKQQSSGAGTTKRKELHGTTCIRALSGTWGEKIDGITFHAYNIDFACSIPDVHYSGFVLLIESKLADDVGNVEIQLYLQSKFIKSSVSSPGQLHLDAEQVAKAKRFQEFFFNGVFGKLFIKSGGIREFLLETDKPLWMPSNMYSLLPLEFQDINWTEIDSCLSAVDFIKQNAQLNPVQLSDTIIHGRSSAKSLENTGLNCTGIIHLTNKSVHKDSLKEVVVLAIHTGKIYSILEFLPDTSAESPVDGNNDANPSKYSSFADYLEKKYHIILEHPEKPLLLLKRSHGARNLLMDFNGNFRS